MPEAGRPWSEIAQNAYEAYLVNLHSHAPDLTDASGWEDLFDEEQWAWEAAVRHASAVTQAAPTGHGTGRWAGWTPPGA